MGNGSVVVFKQSTIIQTTLDMNNLIQRDPRCYAARVGSLFFTISGSDLQAWSIVERREFNLLCGYTNYQLASMMAQVS